jgi:hypothetical protein
MNYTDLFQISIIALVVLGYSALALVLVGRAMIDLSSAVARVAVVRNSLRSRQ